MEDAGRVAALDGIRGVAVLLVLVFHFFLWLGDAGLHVGVAGRLASAGWVGVDLFFVLSGYLITGILDRARGSPGYFRNFYARRTLRIFPLYYATLFGVFAVAAHLLPAQEKLQAAAREQIWLWTYLTNVAGCFKGLGVFYGMGHFWSLAVEEHFYLFWPLLVSTFTRQRMIKVCVAIIACVPLVRLAFSLTVGGAAVYALTLSRMDSLAAGGLLALIARERSLASLVKPARATLPIAACSALALAFFAPTPLHDAFIYSALAALFGSTIVIAVAGGGAFERVARARVLRFFGTYSYGLYVFHHPLRSLFDSLLKPARLAAALHSDALAAIAYVLAAGAISTAIAYASWHLFEKRFISLRRYFEYQPPAASAAAAPPAA